MRLYSGTSVDFVNESIHNQISDKLKTSFFQYYRFNPSPAEIQSWQNSLRALSQVIQYAKLDDHGILLEYQLPLTSKRLDCLITGKDSQKENAVIIELKQWEITERAEGENEVLTWVGGAKREVLHPSVQVGRYQMYLKDTHTAFTENGIQLEACSYLHNYRPQKIDEIYSSKFRKALELQPIFSADDVEGFKDYLYSKLHKGNGMTILNKIEQSKYKPCKQLMDHVSTMIREKSEYVLLDEQLIVYDKVLSLANKGLTGQKKTIIIIKGGPGTGKSVIAINLMSDLLRAGYNTQYATGSKAFTETLRKKVGIRGAAQFKYFNSYSSASPNEIDVLISDEAHRIRETSNNRFTKKILRSDVPQIEELIRVTKLGVFFIDDKQNVRPNEIGSSEFIKDTAIKMGCDVFEYALEAQFRCNGSDAFINWIDNTLGVKRTANVLWDPKEEFDFKIFESPDLLYSAIKIKNDQKANSARLVAGFCWPWSNPDSNGNLVNDVRIGNFSMPWEGKDGYKLSPGIPPASLWPFDPNGVNQIGSIYTIQGFEFEYVGVIIGKDLVYNFENQTWIPVRENSSDAIVKRSGEKLLDLLKNTYRVLLTRGMKGCYVYFIDKDTEKFVKSRIENNQQVEASAAILSMVSSKK